MAMKQKFTLPPLFALAAAIAGCGQSNAGENHAARQPSPETRAAVAGYKAAFEGQTRAPLAEKRAAYKVEVVTEGLDEPWALAFLPDGRMLVTERRGNFRIIARNGLAGPAAAVVPAVLHKGQGGLLDVALDPDFSTNNVIYWSFSEQRGAVNGTSLARGVLDWKGAKPVVRDAKVIFQQQPGWNSDKHFGSRIAFAPDKSIFLALGERSEKEARIHSQDLSMDLGKIVHLNRDGTPAAGNPFAGQAGARPEIWSYGHRNIQAVAFDSSGQLWEIEHGPLGGDELNKVQKGRNYGWPFITYGKEYSGQPVGDGLQQKEGMEQPVYYWDPNIAPSGMIFYSGDAFPNWKGDIFVGGLAGHRIVRLTLSGDRVTGEEWIAADDNTRYRDVRQGPDGFIYALTDEGRIIRIRPSL